MGSRMHKAGPEDGSAETGLGEKVGRELEVSEGFMALFNG